MESQILWRERAFWLYPIKAYGTILFLVFICGYSINYLRYYFPGLYFISNFLLLFSAGLILWGIYLFWRMIFERYELTETELKIYTGIINKRVDSLDVLRVKDVYSFKPIYFIPFGVANVYINTVDRTHPRFCLKGVKNYTQVKDIFARIIRKNLSQSLIFE